MIAEAIKWFTIITLLFLSYQDFKFRAISWWLLVILILLPLSFIQNLNMSYFQQIGINGMLLTVQLSLTALYFKIKGISYQKLVQEYIGIGDLLFFGVMIFYFSPLNFIVFFNFSLLFSLVFYGIYKVIVKSKNVLIPLAGLQAICLAITIILPVYRFDDNFIFEWIL